MKKIFAGLILISVIVFAVMTGKELKSFLPEPKQAGAAAVRADGSVCLAEEKKGNSFLYRMDTDGTVRQFFPVSEIYTEGEVLDLCTAGDRLYVMNYSEAGSEAAYSLAGFDEKFVPEFVYECRDFDPSYHFSSISAEKGNVYITFLSQYRDSAMVYALAPEEEKKAWKPVLTRTAETGRTFRKAVYQDGRLEVLFDQGKTGYYEKRAFTEEELVFSDAVPLRAGAEVKAEGSVYTAFLSQILYRNIMLLLLFFALFAIPVVGMMNTHSFAIQRLSAMELILILLVLSGGIFVFRTINENRQEDRMAYALSSLKLMREDIGNYQTGMESPDYYTEQDYASLQTGLMRWEESQKMISALNVLNLKETEPYLMASASESAGETLAETYGAELSDFVKRSREAGRGMTGTVRIRGAEYGVIIMPEENKAIADYALMVLVPFRDLIQAEKLLEKTVMRWMGISLLAGTVLLSIVTIMLSASMQRFSKTMEAVARGQRDFKKPGVDSDEMHVMWNSLSELNKNVEQAEYTKFKIYESYSRFAPKRIEELLGRESIVEVVPGDFRQLSATLGIICMDSGRTMESGEYREMLSKQLTCIGRLGKEYRGVIVNTGCRLTELKMLFLDEVHFSVLFGIEMVHELRKTSVLLHRAEYQYGVAGSEEEPVTYLNSPELPVLERYAGKLREHGVCMAATETVIHDVGTDISTRYIGYLQMSDEKHLNLYEILDAYGEKERRSRMAQDGLFQKAIDLYYKDEFYLARNTFTEIVKSSPSDKVAKWYLFACEEYLNQNRTGQIKYGLFAE